MRRTHYITAFPHYQEETAPRWESIFVRLSDDTSAAEYRVPVIQFPPGTTIGEKREKGKTKREKRKVKITRKKRRASSENRRFFLVGEGGFEPPKALPADLQSVPFGHSGIPPYSLFADCGGAGGRIRTPDLLITNQLLYRLSYTSVSTSFDIIAKHLIFVNMFFLKY